MESDMIANRFGTIIMNEDNKDVIYGAIPRSVKLQYLDKDGKPLGIPQKTEFNSLSAYILWVIDVSSTLVPLSDEYSRFSYFACTRKVGETLEIENQYVRRVYTFEDA